VARRKSGLWLELYPTFLPFWPFLLTVDLSVRAAGKLLQASCRHSTLSCTSPSSSPFTLPQFVHVVGHQPLFIWIPCLIFASDFSIPLSSYEDG
jgi:hypothetical protein